MRNRFDQQLDLLSEHLLEMGALIERSIEKATQALIRQKAELTQALQKALCRRIRYRVPVGSLTGVAVLNGRGPKLPLMLAAEGAVSVEYRTELTTAGINRTRYAVVLCVTANVHNLSVKNPQSVTVESSFPIYESVTDGEVPSGLYDFR